jgi:hypothetical protein
MPVEEMLAARAKFEEECTEQCPRCHQMTLHPRQVMNALCRRDNETYICSPCGRQQAMNDYMSRVSSTLNC